MNLLLDLGSSIRAVANPLVYVLLIANALAFLAFKVIQPERRRELVLVTGSVGATLTSLYLLVLLA